jgi:thimet oligopeptidase
VTASNELKPLTLPTPDEWGVWLGDRAQGQIEVARAIAERLRGNPTAHRDVTLGQWNELNVALSNASAACSLLSQVHPDAELRSQAEAAEQEVDKFATDLSLDRDLYDVLAGINPAGLDDEALRLLDRTLRDFKRAGVDRDESTRQRLREIAERETALTQEFSKNIREDVHSVALRAEQLRGLPDDYIKDHPAGADGLHTVTTDYPDVYPFLTFAEDAAARRQLHIEFLRRGWPSNDELLQELLATRAEHAGILGYDGWPDFDAEVKMIGRGDAIGEFIERITAAAETSGRRDRDILLARLQQDDPAARTIDRADATHYAELVRREDFDVDAQEVRRYFDFGKVRDGLLDVTGRLFGLDYRLVDVATWHEDVAVYDVFLDGALLGRIYLDLHPREGKYKHAAQFDLARGVLGAQLPEGVLVCNFPRGLMEHNDVITLFHEFGHLVHHVLGGRQRFVRFSGVATEWDFVEAPSQLLEEWAWDADVLRTFATNVDGTPIPVALVERMRAAHDFGRGYQARTQMFYAAVSYRLHRDRVDDLTAFVRELQTAYDLFPFVEGTHFHASFGHLGGYTSAYYTYMWSLVIAKDLLSGFDSDDLMAPTAALRYRDAILAPGGRKDAARLVEDFLGRPYDFAAFARWLDGPGASSADDHDN